MAKTDMNYDPTEIEIVTSQENVPDDSNVIINNKISEQNIRLNILKNNAENTSLQQYLEALQNELDAPENNDFKLTAKYTISHINSITSPLGKDDTMSSRTEWCLSAATDFRKKKRNQIANLIELITYEAACTSVNNEIEKITTPEIKTASRQIRNELIAARKHNSTAIRQLSKLAASQTDFLRNPNEKNTTNVLQHASEALKPSKFAIVAGSVFVILGVTLILGSIALAVATFGGASPASVAGAAVGAATIAGGLAIASGVAATGVLSFCAAASFFKSPSTLSSGVTKLVSTAKGKEFRGTCAPEDEFDIQSSDSDRPREEISEDDQNDEMYENTVSSSPRSPSI